MEKFTQERKEEKKINDLLAKLSESTYTDIADIERIIGLEQDIFKSNLAILTKFIDNVKNDCAM